MPIEEFSDISSVKVLLTDARERIKETEDRCNKKSEEIEKRLTVKLDELDTNYNSIHTKIIEWMPLLSTLAKNEESKRNLYLMLVASFISNVASWILTLFLYFVKANGGSGIK